MPEMRESPARTTKKLKVILGTVTVTMVAIMTMTMTMPVAVTLTMQSFPKGHSLS